MKNRNKRNGYIPLVMNKSWNLLVKTDLAEVFDGLCTTITNENRSKNVHLNVIEKVNRKKRKESEGYIFLVLESRFGF